MDASPICLPKRPCPWGLSCGIWWQARAVGSLSPLLPFLLAQRLPHETAFSSSRESGFGFQILVLPLLICVALGKSLTLSGPVFASVKRCW